MPWVGRTVSRIQNQLPFFYEQFLREKRPANPCKQVVFAARQGSTKFVYRSVRGVPHVCKFFSAYVKYFSGVNNSVPHCQSPIFVFSICLNWDFFFQGRNKKSLRLSCIKSNMTITRLPVTFGSNMYKTQWLTSGEWGCPLDNGPKLAVGQPNSS